MTRPKADQLKLDKRREQALRLRARGMQFDAIARKLNEQAESENCWDQYTDGEHCWQDVQLALTVYRVRREKATEEFFQLELEKLDMMEEVVWKVLETRHYVVNQGMVVYMGNDPNRVGNPFSGAKALAEHLREFPLEDDAPVLQAVDRLIKIQDQRAKFVGAYAPVKKALEVSSGPGTNAAIDRLMALVAGGRQAEAATSAPAGAGTSDVPDTRSTGRLPG